MSPIYSLRGFWLTLVTDEPSFHQRGPLHAESVGKLLRVGPSVLTSSKLLRV